MKITARKAGITAGVVALLLAALWVFDQHVPKSPEMAVWKERCAGWQVSSTYFTDDATEFYVTGESKLIRQGEPYEFGFSYGGQFFGVGKPIVRPGETLPPDKGVERDTLVVKLLKDTHQDVKRYRIAVVVMHR